MPAPSVKKGQKVNFVIPGGDHAEAKVTSDGANEWGQIDLVVDAKHPKHGGLTVTKSPHDPKAERPDSWHVPGALSAAPAVPAAPQTDPSVHRTKFPDAAK